MNKNAIKQFATEARRELISRVGQRALKYGISDVEIGNPNDDSVGGHLLSSTEKKQRAALIEQIKEKGYDQVMEEVAYTWFNRFSALRFMEVNGYLPTRVRVFTDENNSFKPQILTEAIHMELDGLDMEKVYTYKEANDDDELYKYLLITQCNALGRVLPGMFQKISDYTELLFPDNLLREGSVVHQMIELIDEEDWKNAVQIIGWLYQYYNSEKKDDVFAALKKNVKITKENIPAATQLFTPDWIVRYMVENSLGRLWVEGHPNDVLKSNWKYYLKEAEQEPGVQAQLATIREEYKALKPEDILCIDPCSGSGHILAYMFDVLVQIYEAYGVDTRSAVASIVENNIYGLDIDDRAAQLSYFTVMMKACQYDKRFFRRKVQPHVYAIVESNHVDRHAVEYFCNGDDKLKEAMDTIIKELHDAKEYGSIIKVSNQDWDALYARFDEIQNDSVKYIYTESSLQLKPIVQCAEVLSRKYSVAVTNPPYMGNMSVKMTEYVQKYYADEKYDLYSVFVKRCFDFVVRNGMASSITQHTWMFISSFEKFRKNLTHKSYISILHLGTRAFEEIGGEVVQTAAMVWRNTFITDNKVVATRLVDYTDAKEKESAYLENIDRYVTHQDNFSLLPGEPIVYWLSDSFFSALKKNVFIDSFVERKSGVVTGDDNYFLRFWYEASYKDISFVGTKDSEYKKYHVMSKGGSARRFYGNYEYVIRLKDLWNPSKTNISVRRGDSEFYFKKAIGWSQVGNAQKTFRYVVNSVCGTATPTIYLKDDKYFNYILGFLNTKIAFEYLVAYNPTINLLTTDICNLPLIVDESVIPLIDSLIDTSIDIAKADWDSFETSWDFKHHPLVRKVPTIVEAYDLWQAECDDRFNQLKANEEELNRIFIDIYGLQDELTPEVEDKDVTVRKADLERDIKSFISYAVGCMFGRYSLDVEGLAYAGGDWDASKYPSFAADKDNIIPICDDEYFDDDIVGRFVKFVEVVYGKDTLDENLKFIADALGANGQPKDVIRKYFLNGFYKDHCKMYHKRPIYWMFDSGKKNGFKCLIYMHRYQPDTLARIRTDYVHEQQARYRTAIEDFENRMANASTSERVKLNKQVNKLTDQAIEIHEYEEKIHHLADQMISIDLDDGVKKNYEIFQDVLAKIK